MKTLPSAVLFAVVVVACSSSSTSSSESHDSPAPVGQCRSVSDCSGTEQCQSGAATAALETPRHPLMAAPCPYTACNSDEQCPGGVCESLDARATAVFGNCFIGLTCQPLCTDDVCAGAHTCAANGHCALVPCTDPSFAGCPSGWYCDEAAATAGPTDPVIGWLSVDGSTGMAQDASYLSVGCRQLRCDEVGGPTCLDNWVCEPEAAPDSVGCRALPCTETGNCSDDSLYICEPTSPNGRAAGMDPHGCVLRNCEEGKMCVQYQICDFTRPDADASGCDFLSCDEPGGLCPNVNTVCDPSNEFADVYGCRAANCVEQTQSLCPAGWTCDPNDGSADSIGCVPPATSGSGGQTSVPTGAPLGGACRLDADCQQGYCVQDACATTLGQCTAP